jgi:hypothetical protein
LRERQAAASQQQSDQTQHPERRPDERGSPQLNALVMDVYPTALAERSEGTAVNELKIARSAKVITLILNSQNQTSHRSYTVEIVNARNEKVWSSDGLVRQSAGDYTISVPASFLNRGSYRINIYATGNGGRTNVESYQLLVTRPGR